MNWWQYLLLVNLYLVLFYTFYVLLLHAETFFKLNRMYLVVSALLSFFIPLLHADWVKDLFITQKVQHTLLAYTSPGLIIYFKPAEDHLTLGQLMLLVYAAGIIILTARFIGRLISLKSIIKQPGTYGPFSFFKSIRVDPISENKKVIAAHEQVHAQQWHSADVLLMELITIVNWFNPVVYFYRLAIKHIHEFIADSQAVKSGTDKADYALLLLSQSLNIQTHQLVNSFFNHSLLKKRIIMLQKNQSKRTALLKYGLSAPLFILMLILSSATISKSSTVKLIGHKAAQALSTPALIQNSENNSLFGVKREAVKADTASVKNKETVYYAVETTPQFKGGIRAFYQFLAQNIKYPEAMKKNNIQGRVFIAFVVRKDGSLTDIKILRDIGYGAGEEAARVIKLSPKWNPGMQNGKAVNVQYTMPINFALDDKSPKTGMVDEKGDSTKKPLYLVDGKEITDVNKIKPDDIESIDVIKGNSLVSKYGEKAANGVVSIKLKKPVN